MIITKAMPTPQTATTGVSHPIAAGQGITSGLCRGPGGSRGGSRGVSHAARDPRPFTVRRLLPGSVVGGPAPGTAVTQARRAGQQRQSVRAPFEAADSEDGTRTVKSPRNLHNLNLFPRFSSNRACNPKLQLRGSLDVNPVTE